MWHHCCRVSWGLAEQGHSSQTHMEAFGNEEIVDPNTVNPSDLHDSDPNHENIDNQIHQLKM